MIYQFAEINESDNTLRAYGQAPFIPDFAPGCGIKAVDITGIDPRPEPGDTWDPETNTWTTPPPPPPKPQLVIMEVTGENVVASEDLSDITLPLGASLTAVFEIQVDGKKVSSISMPAVRMPIAASDGRTVYAKIDIAKGKGTAKWRPRDSGKWLITQENINSELPAEAQMEFSGLSIFVYED